MTLEIIQSVCQALVEKKITAVSAALLIRLNQGSASMSELTKITGHAPGNTTQLIDRLASLKWVSRSPSDDDRRAVIVSITLEGRANLIALKKAIR